MLWEGLTMDHACRIVKEGRGHFWAIQTREPGDRWRRYSGGMRTKYEAREKLAEYRASGWFPASMIQMPYAVITGDEAAQSALP